MKPIKKGLSHLYLGLAIVGHFIEIGECKPEFVRNLQDQNVTIGKEVRFQCEVRNINGYKIVWMRRDTKMVLAIHDFVVASFKDKFSARFNYHTYELKISKVKPEDAGIYMCQINTYPMMYQTAKLTVFVPPDLVEASSDLHLVEGASGEMYCIAKGNPHPTVTWKREDGRNISLKTNVIPDADGSYSNERLTFNKVSRNDIGMYGCYASNGVHPTVMKKIFLHVTSMPSLIVPNQLIGSVLGMPVTMVCYISAYPKPINYWIKHPETMIMNNSRYLSLDIHENTIEFKSVLIVKNMTEEEYGKYVCITKNSIGTAEGSITIYPLRNVTGKMTSLAEIVTYTNGTKKRNEISKGWQMTSDLYSIKIGLTVVIVSFFVY